MTCVAMHQVGHGNVVAFLEAETDANNRMGPPDG